MDIKSHGVYNPRAQIIFSELTFDAMIRHACVGSKSWRNHARRGTLLPPAGQRSWTISSILKKYVLTETMIRFDCADHIPVKLCCMDNRNLEIARTHLALCLIEYADRMARANAQVHHELSVSIVTQILQASINVSGSSKVNRLLRCRL